MDIDFCVVDVAFSSGDDFTIFFTRSGLNDLDPTIRKEVEYEKVVKTMKKHAYSEIDEFTFEYTGGIGKKKPKTRNELISTLMDAGFFHSLTFEDAMKKKLEKLTRAIDIKKGKSIEKIFNESINEKTVPAKPKRRKHINIIPSYGEKIDITFLLVADFIFQDKDVFGIDLNGGFDPQKGNPNTYRNIIKIITEKFERFAIDDREFDMIHFRSLKSKGEILEEVGFLYEVFIDSLKFRPNQRKKSFYAKEFHYFDIFDIRDKINLDERIVISVDVSDYSNLIELSESILSDKYLQLDKNIDFEDIEFSTIELIDKLNIKMTYYAHHEEFIMAAKIKKDINKITSKIERYKENPIVGKLSPEDFHNLFNLK